MKKRIRAIIIITLAIIVVTIYYYFSKSGTTNSGAVNSDTTVKGHTVKGYVKEVDLDNRRIFITNDFGNVSIKECLADYVIYIGEDTVISDGRDLASIEQGVHIVATYIGGILETGPAQVEGTVLIQFD